ncbi:MAG: Na/Pi cotransporter family protein [Planctomycetia bacterium]|nr:Na/Pi cotransporter family protein [Planctomycetia bacterium]
MDLPNAGQTDSVTVALGDREQDFHDANIEVDDQKSGNVPVKWIPSQRVLAGAPPTHIDLNDVIQRFRALGSFGGRNAPFDPSKLEVAIASPVVESVVIPKLAGDSLVLHWAKDGSGKSEIIISLKYPDMPPVFVSFMTEVWRPNYFAMIAIVIGGLGLFLFGMKNMSEGLQMIAGASLRRMIAVFTENRFLALGIGVLATMLVQSSSVTTVMVVGFINSQIMTLSQGISVIMGANIGTTATGWLLALKIGDYGLPLLGISSFFYIFAKNNRIRYISMSLMGLGFLFFGLKTMESGFALLAELPEFAATLKLFVANSYWGTLKCIFVGCLITMLVQSSAVTLGITISLASIGAIDFATAAALVLGENIGTTITALLVSIGTATNARRAAYFHSLFNCIGVAWVSIVFLPFLLPLVTRLAHVHDGENVAAGIAMTHTLFNVTNAILFLPFTAFFARLLTRIVPETEQKSKQPKLSLTSLGIRGMETPIIAIERSRVEVLRMVNGCMELADWYKKVAEDDYSDEKLIEQMFRQEATLDNMQDEVITFLAEMLGKNHSQEIATTAQEQLRFADELETISDYYISILKSNLKLKENGLALPELERENFRKLFDDLTEQLGMIRQVFVQRSGNLELLQEIYSRRNVFTPRVKDLRDRFMRRIADDHYAPQVIIAVSSQLNYYRRLREHLQNIAEAMKS